MVMNRATRPRCDEPREITADAHREQVAADDRGELQDAVAEQIARERAGDQLIDQPASGDQKDGDEQRSRHDSASGRALMHRGGDDDAHADRHCADQNRQRRVRARR